MNRLFPSLPAFSFVAVCLLIVQANVLATEQPESTLPPAPLPTNVRPPFSPAETQAARNYFKHLCEHEVYTVIHRQVPEVAEIWLQKLRDAQPKQARSAIWPGPYPQGVALFGYKLYVLPLLLYEHPIGAHPLSHSVRGFLAGHATEFPGYQAVHVQDPQSGQHHRVRAVLTPRRLRSKLPVYELDPQPNNGPWPRYAVTHTDHPTPREVQFGISRVTLEVIDTHTGEVIAQAQRFAHTGAAIDRPNRYESEVCPAPNWWAYHLRYFVDQVLIPAGRAL